GVGGRSRRRSAAGRRGGGPRRGALPPPPGLLLLGEPLAALDGPTREQLRGELRRLLAGLRVPTLLVTHDRLEAAVLGNVVAVVDGGRIRQSGPVEEVFARPVDAAVARIVGIATVEPARVLARGEGVATVAGGRLRPARPPPPPETRATSASAPRTCGWKRGRIPAGRPTCCPAWFVSWSPRGRWCVSDWTVASR